MHTYIYVYLYVFFVTIVSPHLVPHVRLGIPRFQGNNLPAQGI